MMISSAACRSFVTLGLLALLVTGCSAQTTRTPVPSEPLRIGYNQWAGYGSINIAAEKGLFEKFGVKVKLVSYTSFELANSDFAGQKLDGNLITLTDGVALAANGLPVEMIWICDTSHGSDVIVSNQLITSAKALKGKKVGLSFGSFGHLFVLQALNNVGLTDTDIEVINVRPEEVPQALAKGEIDAGHTWEPYLSQAVKNGGNILTTSAETPGVIVDTLLFRSAITKQRPAEIEAIIRAISESEAWWRANPAEGNKIVAKAIGVTPEEMPAILSGIKVFSLQDNIEAFKPVDQNQQGVLTSIQSNVEFFVSKKIIKQISDITSFTNNSFVQAVAQK
jgi:NitT/TauT family transport system substrate-binding protein